MVGNAQEIAQSVGGLTFDTGGTVFDWYTGILRALIRAGERLSITADWPTVTWAWRQQSTGMVNDGLPEAIGRASMDMDDVLKVSLDRVLSEFGLDAIPDEERQRLVRAWRELDAWPDARTGLPRLRERFIITPFTILNTELVILASRRSRLSWDCVISCEMIGTYKTHPRSYATAAHWLGLKPENLMMVTTHNNDLRAAHACGFRTAYVYRNDEWGPRPSLDPDPDPLADIVCQDFDDLADQLGCPAGIAVGAAPMRLFSATGA